MMRTLLVAAAAASTALAASVLDTLPAPDDHVIGLAWQDGYVWAVDNVSGMAYRMDSQTGQVMQSFMPYQSGSYTPYGLACSSDTLFVNYGKGVSGGVQGMYDTDTGGYLGTVPFC